MLQRTTELTRREPPHNGKITTKNYLYTCMSNEEEELYHRPVLTAHEVGSRSFEITIKKRQELKTTKKARNKTTTSRDDNGGERMCYALLSSSMKYLHGIV